MSNSSICAFLFSSIFWVSCAEITQGITSSELLEIKSPNQKAKIIQSNSAVSNSFHISVYAEIETPLATGGGGVFDIVVQSRDTLQITWSSDSTVTIGIPKAGKVLQQKEQLFFAGRTIYFKYYFINDSVESAVKQVVDSSLNVLVGAWQTFESLPKLRFARSTEQEFLQAQAAPISALPQLEQTDSVFYLPTAFDKKMYLKYQNSFTNSGWNGTIYKRYYADIQFYGIETWTSSSEGLSFGTLVLIDSLTSHTYSLASVGDGPIETPSFSPNKRFMAYYYNFEYELNECFIGIVALNADARFEAKDFMIEIGSLSTTKLAVEALKWKNDSVLLLKAFQKADFSRDKTFSYYKMNLKSIDKQ